MYKNLLVKIYRPDLKIVWHKWSLSQTLASTTPGLYRNYADSSKILKATSSNQTDHLHSVDMQRNSNFFMQTLKTDQCPVSSESLLVCILLVIQCTGFYVFSVLCLLCFCAFLFICAECGHLLGKG